MKRYTNITSRRTDRQSGSEISSLKQMNAKRMFDYVKSLQYNETTFQTH